MKNTLLGLLLISYFIFPVNGKDKSKPQTISGKQYVVLASDPKPLPDHTIFYKPCNKEKDCQDFERSNSAAIKHAQSDPLLKSLVSDTLKKMQKPGKVMQINTDFNGDYSFRCPTSKCLVYSYNKTTLGHSVWLKVVNSNSKFDLTNSTMIHRVTGAHSTPIVDQLTAKISRLPKQAK